MGTIKTVFVTWLRFLPYFVVTYILVTGVPFLVSAIGKLRAATVEKLPGGTVSK